VPGGWQLEIQSKDPELSGKDLSSAFKQLYTFDLCVEFSAFSPPPSSICYSLSKSSAQPTLQFYMRDRCFGMTFVEPDVWYNEIDNQLNNVLNTAKLS